MKLILVILLSISFQIGFSQNYIVKQEERVLNLCTSHHEDTICTAFSNVLNEVLVDLYDTLFKTSFQQGFTLQLYYKLAAINEKNIADLPVIITDLNTLHTYINAYKTNNLANYFKNLSVPKGASIFQFFESSPLLYPFITKAAISHPTLMLKKFKHYKEHSLADKMLLNIVVANPIIIKRYLNSNTSVRQTLLKSQSDTAKLLVQIHQEVGNASKAYSLMDDIFHHKKTITEAHEIGNGNQRIYFNALIRLAKQDEYLAKDAVDNELKYLATQFIRPINADHEMHASSLRFKPLQPYTTDELYTLMVYSEEEIFTSTYEGIYSLFLKKLANKDGYDFLEDMGFNQFRTFLKMNAGYGTLNSFLSTLSKEKQSLLLNKFLDLRDVHYLLKEAVSIADAMGSIQDKKLLHFIEKKLLYYYTETNDSDIKRAYGLLMKLFYNQVKTYTAEYESIVNQYKMNALDVMDSAAIYGTDGVHTQVHFFYDDDDGISSYVSFMQHFKSNKWRIEDNQTFVKITAVAGQAVVIYANKAIFEKEGTQRIVDLVASSDLEIDMLVHRGHSFYVNTSLEKLQEETSLVLLGSCGGYHQVLKILETAPDAHIIATKQIGSHTVNNPLLLDLATWINEGKEIEWNSFWENLSTRVKNNAYATEKLKEYIPPHKNLGAAFIKAYRNQENESF